MHFLCFVLLATGLTFTSVQPANAASDGYPSRPIQLMIPASKGGGADISFRVLAQAMEPILGQKIEIVNEPADSGAVGLAALAKAKPDGYTLGAVWNGPLTASPQVRELAYSIDSFSPIASTFESDYTVCVHKDFPAGTGPALVTLLREKPLGYTYGNEGKGGGGYFAAERLFDALGVIVRSESFNGSGEAARMLAEGKVDLYVGSTPAIMPQIKSRQAKCLIIMSEHRPDILRGVSTLPDLGAKGCEASLWRLILAPKGLPEDRISKVETAIRKAMAAPATQAFLSAEGERPFVQDGPETMARLREEFTAFSEMAGRLGLKHE